MSKRNRENPFDKFRENPFDRHRKNPFDNHRNKNSSSEEDLSDLFNELKINKTETTENMNMEDTVKLLVSQVAALVATNTELSDKIKNIETVGATSSVTVTEYEDIEPIYDSGDTIQLDAFKVIHEFSGDRKVYRSWRTQVTKLMNQIQNFKSHPKYAAALSIIRAKISGSASDILINNNTAHNINAIIDRLDFSYSDQRPLYVIESEMTAVRQNTKSLQEYYDEINQALNMVITKISMTYKVKAEQKSLIEETQNKAIRTFITGLSSSMIRSTLYGSMPKTLAQAFSIAQTIQYDNQYLQLDFKMQEQKNAKKLNDVKPIFNPNFRYQSTQQNLIQKQNFVPTPQYNPKQNFASTPQYNPYKQISKPTPMDIDTSKQNIQKPQFQSNDFQQMKRPREPTYINKQTSFQHANKQQRVNHLDEKDDIQTIFDDSMKNNHDTEIQDNQSTTSETESIFLDE